MRIVFLGDSLTWGEYGGSFVDVVRELLPEHDIINAGVRGNTVINLLNRLDEALESQPDGVFVMVGGNDAISYSQPETRRYYIMTEGGPDGVVTPELFAEKYRELLTRIQATGAAVWVGLAPNEYSPVLAAAFRQYNDLARDVAESLNVPVLDLMAHFAVDSLPDRPPLDEDYIGLIGKRARMGWKNYDIVRRREGFTFTFDGMHLMPETARQIGELIVTFLRKTMG